jgi:DNA-binding MarR family transcriptional regulator
VVSALQDLGRSIKHLQSRHHRLLDARLIEIGTTLAQWDALRAIASHPDASAHRLAELTFQTDQSFGTLANRLVERGHVLRTPGRGRVIGHRLTPAGEAMLSRAAAVADATLAESFAPLSEAERQTLQALLERLLQEQR